MSQHEENTAQGVNARFDARYLSSASRVLGRATLAWVALALPLHLAWEIAQIRLYTLWDEASLPYIAYAIVHCTAGDGLIAIATFGLAALLARDLAWPWRAPRLGVAVLLPAGIAYTAASEWVNVYRLGRWAYSSAMPTLAGIGLAPIAQWIVVPLATFLLYRRLFAPRSRGRKQSNRCQPQGDGP